MTLPRSTHSSGESSPASSPRLSGPGTPATDFDSILDLSLATDRLPVQYVLVTGGLGFIGSHTVLELLKAGYNVIIVDDLSNSYPDVFGRIVTIARRHFDRCGGQCPKAELHTVSYRDLSAMRQVIESHGICRERKTDSLDPQPSSTLRPPSSILGVIHFAGFKAVEESIREPLKYYRNNISGLVDFLAFLDQYAIRNFIFSSSATVYGSLADGSRVLREEDCVHEETAYVDGDGQERRSQSGFVGITSPYGRTKFFGEAILSDLAHADAAWSIVGLRYFNPIGCDPSGLLGEDPRGVPSNLLPVVVKVLTGQYDELSVFGGDWSTPDGTAIRDYIHVSDLARGHIAALTAAQEGRFNGGYRTFNIGTGKGSSVLEVVAAMESVSGRQLATKTVSRRPGDVQSSVAAADRAKMELGWMSQESLTNACRDVWNYLQLRGM